MNQRSIKALAAMACMAWPAVTPAATDDFPARAVRIIHPYEPGSGADGRARLFGQEMSGIFGQPVIIENRPGAGGAVGAAQVARAAPDGHTLLWGTSTSHSVSVVAMPNLSYDPIKDFAPISLMNKVPNALFVHPGVPAQNVSELIAFLKKASGATSIATGGASTSGRIATEAMKSVLGVELTVVNYKGSARAVADVAGKHVPLGIVSVETAGQAIKGNLVRAIATTGLNRSNLVPDVPTLNETVMKGFESVAWGALFAPASTPRSAIMKINVTLHDILKKPGFRQKAEAGGSEIALSSPEELTKFMREDIERWKELTRKYNLKFDS